MTNLRQKHLLHYKRSEPYKFEQYIYYNGIAKHTYRDQNQDTYNKGHPSPHQ